jgi:hypothetical protein
VVAVNQNLVIEQGATFRYRGIWKGLSEIKGGYQPFDISQTAGSMIMQIRRAPGATPYLTIATAPPTRTNPSSILILEERGEFEIYISMRDTSKFGFSRAKYDIFFLFKDGESVVVMRGNIIVIPRITDLVELSESDSSTASEDVS